MVPLPLNEVRPPPDTVTSARAKLVVFSLLVNVIVSGVSLVVDPSLIAVLLLFAAVIVIVGPVLSLKVAVL